MYGFLARRRFNYMKRLFNGGIEGGFYPILPGVNLWQDEWKTTPALLDGDPVRVIEKVAGTFNDMVARSDIRRPTLRKVGDKYLIEYNQDQFLVIENMTIDNGYSFIIKASSRADGFNRVLVCFNKFGMGLEHSLTIKRSPGLNYSINFGSNEHSEYMVDANIQTDQLHTFAILQNWPDVNCYLDGNLAGSTNNLNSDIGLMAGFNGAIGAEWDYTSSSYSNPWDGYAGGFLIVNNNNPGVITRISKTI